MDYSASPVAATDRLPAIAGELYPQQEAVRCVARTVPEVTTEMSELWLDHACVVEASRNVMDGMYRRSVHAGKRVADFERQSLDVLRTAWVAVPLARAYPGGTSQQESARIPAANAKSRTPMRHMVVPHSRCIGSANTRRKKRQRIVLD